MDAKKPGIGLLIAMKGKPKGAEDGDGADTEAGPSAFEDAASQCMDCIKSGDAKGFADALKLAIEAGQD